MIRVVLYVIVTPIMLWVIESINMNQLFKKNRIYQAQLFQFLLIVIMSYLVVNFFYDLFYYTQFI
jgi:uncharacterized membrane protein YwzB